MMGGYGSGRGYGYRTRTQEDSLWRFSMSSLRKHGVIQEECICSGVWQWLINGEKRSSIGYFVDTSCESPYIKVNHTNKRTGEERDYKIRLCHTTPNYGGKRWWFICPAQGCGKRVGVLFLASILACRHCYNMAYSSQNEAEHYRILNKAQAIHRSLGGSGCCYDPLTKPKHMHWETYFRKLDEMRRLHHMSEVMAFAAIGFAPEKLW